MLETFIVASLVHFWNWKQVILVTWEKKMQNKNRNKNWCIHWRNNDGLATDHQLPNTVLFQSLQINGGLTMERFRCISVAPELGDGAGERLDGGCAVVDPSLNLTTDHIFRRYPFSDAVNGGGWCPLLFRRYCPFKTE